MPRHNKKNKQPSVSTLRLIRNEMRLFHQMQFSEDPHSFCNSPWYPITIQGICRIDATSDKTFAYLTKTVVIDLAAQLGIPAGDFKLEARFQWVKVWGPLPDHPGFGSVTQVVFADIQRLTNTVPFPSLTTIEDYGGGVTRSHVGIRYGLVQSEYVRTLDHKSVDVLFQLSTSAAVKDVDHTYQIHMLWRAYDGAYAMH